MRRSVILKLMIIGLTINSLQAINPDFRYIAEQAIKAPSGHNTQPWLIKINEDRIEIHPNFNKSLKIVDPDNRELFISLGCATENACIAASVKKYSSDVSVTKDSVIIIRLSRDETIKENSLVEFIPLRQTNRSVYNNKIITDSIIQLLKSISLERDIHLYLFKNGTVEYNNVGELITKGNIQQMENPAFVGELKSWMRFNKGESIKTNDGLSYAVMGAPNLPSFISKPIVSSYLTPKMQNKGDREKIESSSHFALFTTKTNSAKDWINLGRSLQRFLLTTTSFGIANAFMNQPCEIKELSVELNKRLDIDSEYPTILVRIGYAKSMPYSLRKNIEEVTLK